MLVPSVTTLKTKLIAYDLSDLEALFQAAFCTFSIFRDNTFDNSLVYTKENIKCLDYSKKLTDSQNAETSNYTTISRIAAVVIELQLQTSGYRPL